MRINHTQNRPIFGANTVIYNEDVFASYIKRSATLDRFERQVKATEKIGDKRVRTTILFMFDPLKSKPYGFLMEIKQPNGKRTVRVRENLRVAQLAQEAAKAFQRAEKAIFARAKHKEVKDDFTKHRNLKRLSAMGNSTTI